MRLSVINKKLHAATLLVGFTALLCGTVCIAYAATPEPASPKKDVRRILLEEQKIEGKIRRPQLVLIKADQRPEFEPMMMQSFGKKADIVRSVTQSVIETSPYDGAFQFQDKKINNYVP